MLFVVVEYLVGICESREKCKDPKIAKKDLLGEIFVTSIESDSLYTVSTVRVPAERVWRKTVNNTKNLANDVRWKIIGGNSTCKDDFWFSSYCCGACCTDDQNTRVHWRSKFMYPSRNYLNISGYHLASLKCEYHTWRQVWHATKIKHDSSTIIMGATSVNKLGVMVGWFPSCHFRVCCTEPSVDQGYKHNLKI